MSRTIPQWMKDEKYHFCAVCGRTEDLQYHHFVPMSLGGANEPSNIIVLCAEFHQRWHQQGGAIKHNELIKEGIAKAKERGVRVGRKPSDGERIMRAIAEKSTQFNPGSLMTEGEIREELGIKNVCYCKYKRRLIETMGEETWPFDWPKPAVMMKRPLYDGVIKKMRGERA